MRLLCVTTLAAFGAWASEPLPTWGLKWKAPPACLQPAELAERVEHRAGRALFSALAPRHIEGYVAEAAQGFRVRLTLLDDGGRILGTREFSSAVAECRALDERVVLMLVLLIEPYSAPLPSRPPLMQLPPEPVQPEAVQAATVRVDQLETVRLVPRPLPSPLLDTLEVRGKGHLLRSHWIPLEAFYWHLRRPDLVDKLEVRRAGRSALFTLGGLSTAGAVGLWIAAISGAGCTQFSGAAGAPGSCLSPPPGWYAGAAITSAFALVAFVWAAMIDPRPTTREEDERLAAEHNAALSAPP